MYKEITEEQKKKIYGLFFEENESDQKWFEHCLESRDLKFNFRTKKDGYYITIEQMYEYVSFKEGVSFLKGMQEITKILGVEDGDEESRYHSNGCETCDYGSCYTLSWRFW